MHLKKLTAAMMKGDKKKLAAKTGEAREQYRGKATGKSISRDSQRR